MAKRMKTGGRKKKAEGEKYERKIFTLSPEAVAIVEKEENQSAFVNEAILERDARRQS